MSLAIPESLPKSRLKAVLEHFAAIENPREPWRVAFPLPEVLLLVVCGTICDCADYDLIAAWGEAHLPVLRRYRPYHHGVPGGRWLTLLMNRIDPHLFAQALTDWVRATWPDRPDFVAIDGKPRAAATTGPRGRRRCIWSRPSPRRAASSSARRRCPTRPARPRPSPP